MIYGEYEQVNGAVANALQAEVDALRKDAERYRWLRDHGDSLGYLESWLPLDRAEWDAAIDAAMNGANT